MESTPLDPVYHAHCKFRRRDFDGCIAVCTELLQRNPYDQAVWFLKLRALAEKSYIDDSDWDEEGIAEVLLDDNAMAQAPRPGTSMNRPMTAARLGTSLAAGGATAFNRPMTSSGRPITGFARPGTSAMMRPPTSAAGGGMMNRDAVATAMRGQRPGTSRAMTALGRAVRIGTASMLSTPGGPFINSDRLDMRKYGQRPALAKALWEYLWFVEANPRKAMELSAAATQAAFFNDWWWKQKLGKCYYALGMTREAEQQFKSSLKAQEHVGTYLELSKLYQNKLDQPTAAHETLVKGHEIFPRDAHLLLAQARLHDAMAFASGGAPTAAIGTNPQAVPLVTPADRATQLYKEVLLTLDASNVEALSCLAAQSFYSDMPELSLKHYRRLLQMGLGSYSSELWNNLGLSCFYSGQYDLSLGCFDRALALLPSSATAAASSSSSSSSSAGSGAGGGSAADTSASDTLASDIWYNLSLVSVSLGDLGLAYQACRVSVALDPGNAEAYSNLGVLEMRKGNTEAAKANFATSIRLSGGAGYEALFNGALLAYKTGDFAEAFTLAQQAVQANPSSHDAAELSRLLRQTFIQQ